MVTYQERLRWLIALHWVLVGLAVVLLIASILLGLAVSGASAAIPAAAIGFQSPALKPVWDALVSALRFLGLLVFGNGLVMAILVFSLGLLVGRIAGLQQRIGLLEHDAHSHAPAHSPAPAHSHAPEHHEDEKASVRSASKRQSFLEQHDETTPPA